MKLDLYMPFFGRDFFNALEGLRECVVSGYLRALWYYWSHSHCSGLRDDRDFLRSICHISEADWTYAEPIIFGELFHLDNDHLWQQNRCREEYEKSNNLYEARKGAGIVGATARWNKFAKYPPNAAGEPRPGKQPKL